MKQRGSDFKSPDSPGNAKKKRRTSTAGPGPPTTPPASQAPPMTEFIPPPISGYGESIVASNPFDDAPPMRPMPPMPNRGGPSPQLNMDMCSPPMMPHHIGSPAPDYPFPPRQMGPGPPQHMGPHGHCPPQQHRGMGGPDQMGVPMGMGPGPMGHPMGGHGGPMGPGPMGQGPPMGHGGPMSHGVPMGQGGMGGGPMKGGPDQMGPNPGGMPPNPHGMNGMSMPPGMSMGGNQGWSGPAKPLPIQSGKIYPHDQSLIHNPQNPNAPPIYPCGACHKEVHDNDQAIPCESGCHFFFHRACTGLSDVAYHLLMKEIYAEWVCENCLANRSVPLVKYKP